MLSEILLAALVLVVAVIVTVDVFVTSSEGLDESADGQAGADTDRITATAARPEPGGSRLGATADASPARRPPEGADPPPGDYQRAGSLPAAPAGSSRRGLKNWRVRSRLILLVSIPTVAAVAFGGIRIYSSVHSASVVSSSSSAHSKAVTSVIIASAVVLLVLAIALVSTIVVGRSMVRPLRKLRAGALEVAGQRLPEAVRRMSGADGEDVSLDVEPIDVDSSDEIGEVARAFDQVHREALRLAANEAALRGNVNAMFVNLSRRTQSLVERQIRLIDDLELGEQDAERLASLFQMDHLATRMRRNSENLLVLAGHDISRRWNQPVVLVDVLRAAVSEIEQYDRVTLNVQPGIAVRGQAVNDVVHLLSELAENATSFSSADTPVTVAGHLLSSGGVLLDITDQGVGMGAEEMARANWRLDNPPVVDVAVSRRMGLFVVARLAARHGIRVRLRPAASGGLTALVWLPDEAVTHEVDGNSPGAGRLGPDAAADSLAAASFATAGFATAAPASPGSAAGVFSTAEWGSGERSAAAEAVSAARTPRFAPLRPDSDDTGPFRIRRVPGAGPMPGATTGPLAPFRTSPQTAWDTDAAELSAGPPATADLSPPADADQESAFGAGTDVFGGKVAETSGGTGSGLFGGAGTDMFGGAGPAMFGAAGTGMYGGTAAEAPGDAEAGLPGGADADIAGRTESEAPGGADTDLPGGAGAAATGEAGRDAPGWPDVGLFGRTAADGTAADGTAANGTAATAPPEADAFAPGPDGFGAAPEPETAEPATDDDPFAEHAEGFGVIPEPVLGAPTVGSVAERVTIASDNLSAIGWSPGSSAHGGVVVPPAETRGEASRLPIFEAVESDWFRRGRHAVAGPGQEEEQPESWTSQADEGWRAAELASAPSSAGLTPAGLPKRVPKANLVPGAVGHEPVAPVAVRSAAATRERFASFQRGVREGRAATRGGDDVADGEDEGGL
jgi:signal transduction histidine kinase